MAICVSSALADQKQAVKGDKSDGEARNVKKIKVKKWQENHHHDDMS